MGTNDGPTQWSYKFTAIALRVASSRKTEIIYLMETELLRPAVLFHRWLSSLDCRSSPTTRHESGRRSR